MFVLYWFVLALHVACIFVCVRNLYCWLFVGVVAVLYWFTFVWNGAVLALYFGFVFVLHCRC